MGRILDFLKSQSIPLAIEQRQHVLTFDSEFEDMEAEIKSLQAENTRLQAKVNPLEREVDRLKAQMQQADKKVAQDHSLEEKAEKLMMAIRGGFAC